MAGKNVALIKKQEIVLSPAHRLYFSDYKLFPNKTVRENISLPWKLSRLTAGNPERVNSVLDLVGLLHKAEVFPSELSGGEQQRVSLARAIVNSPLLLLADEPTGNLDPDTSWEIMELLREINRRGTTIVMATHNREIVDRMQKRVIALEKGRLVRDESKGGYAVEA